MTKGKKSLIILLALVVTAGTMACGRQSAKNDRAEIGDTETEEAESVTSIDNTDEDDVFILDGEGSYIELVSGTVTGIGEEDGEQLTTLQLYENILKHCCEILSSEDPWSLETEDDDPFTALYEIAAGSTSEEALRNVGYKTWDYNSDGIDELIIGSMNDDAFDCGCTANQIYDIYTIDGDSPKLLFKGWSRNRCYQMQDDYFLNEGSGGASSSFFGEFSFEYHSNPISMLWAICYFTEYNDSDGRIHVYKNQNGSWDKDLSEEENMTEEDFWEQENESEELVYHMDLTSLADYSNPISVSFFEDYGEAKNTVSWVTLDNPASTSLVFTAKENLTDVKLYKLSFTDVDEEGNPLYEAELLYEQSDLSVTLPLGVDLTFAGDLPSYGISFVDEDGEQHQYAIGESGMDGSVYLEAAEF